MRQHFPVNVSVPQFTINHHILPLARPWIGEINIIDMDVTLELDELMEPHNWKRW